MLMAQGDLCDMIIEQYYKQVYQYCYSRLNGKKEAAEDCTQETFLVLLKKKGKLDLSGNIKVWLYITADRVIKRYLRNERKHTHVPFIEEILPPDDGGFAELIQNDSPLDCLTADDRKLLTEYYESERGHKSELAAKYNRSLYSLYNEIARIRKKVIGYAAQSRDDGQKK